jgi:choline dehydrogenase-like flavoprotein
MGSTRVDRTPSGPVDVCVVGAGVAGGIVAHSLASRGHDVVLLDAGPRFDPASRLERMEKHLRPEHGPEEVWEMGGPRDRYTSSGDVDYPLNRGRVKGVGGSTLHWLGIAQRLHEKDFEMRSRYGLAADWPLSYADLREYYARAEAELGVAGAEDNPFGPPREEEYPMAAFPFSHSDRLFAEACAELGIETHSAPHARNTETYDGRSRCLGFNTCIPVCPSGAKYSGDVHVRKAEAEGARVIDRAPVQRLEHGADPSTLEAAVYRTPDGARHRQRAAQFVVACGGVETPRLLLLSASQAHPDGLANSSGAVGRYFMDHATVTTEARLDRPANTEPIGFETCHSEQFYDHEEPVPGSILLVFGNVDPTSPREVALSGGTGEGGGSGYRAMFERDRWGDDLLAEVRDGFAADRVSIHAGVEMLPREENRVSLDTDTTDAFGNPVPDVSLSVGEHARRTMDRALEIHEAILDEMGAEVVAQTDPSDPNDLRWGWHHMGTTRMGTDPDASVVDARLRAHDVSNLSVVSSSAFVTAGVAAPTLTIAALALRAAEHVAEDL